MKRIMVALIAVLLFVTPALAETKIGYVDLQKALNLSKAGAQAKSDISNLVKKYEGEFKSKQEALQAKGSELQKQGVLLSDTAKAEKERDYQKEMRELQRFQNDVKEELKQKDSEYTKRILDELFVVLQKIGKDEGYTMIIEKNEGAVIFADDSIDLTDALIKAYDASK